MAYYKRPRGQTRPYFVSNADARLCRDAGVSEELISNPIDAPWKDRRTKLAAIRRELHQRAKWKPYYVYGALGYAVLNADGTPDKAALAQAKTMELEALKGKWLLEEEAEELEDMESASVFGEVLSMLAGRVSRRVQAEAVYEAIEGEGSPIAIQGGRLAVYGPLAEDLVNLVERFEVELTAIHDERESDGRAWEEIGEY